MSDIEKRARELLEAEFNAEGRALFERGEAIVITTASALNALRAALTPPEGYVLVPAEPTPVILAAAAVATWPVASHADVQMAMKAAAIVLRESMDPAPGMTLEMVAAAIATMAPAYRAMIAARPEVPHG